MTSDWDAMWAKPFDDGAHYATKHLMEDVAPDVSCAAASESFLDGKVTLHCGNMLAVLPTLAENSIDSCVTDPPYHLTSIVQRFGADDAAPAKSNGTGVYARSSAGFMGQKWDGGDIAFKPETWREVWRVLKPGAHLLAFGGTRTYHRLACAIEDAGFEVRDCIMWVYGSGFPKSLDVSKAIDKAAGARREVVGTSENGIAGGTGKHAGAEDSYGFGKAFDITAPATPATPAAKEWAGWGTALKPACEPIVVARKPLSEPTVAANVLRWGVGALNIDATRVVIVGDRRDPCGADGKQHRTTGGVYGEHKHNDGFDLSKGRWPANLVHDGSAEVVEVFPDSGNNRRANKGGGMGYHGGNGDDRLDAGHHDSGSAARFFYTAKADQDDRLGSKHPTVKPVGLMEWLVRLVTPKGGLVLDPFSGTGTTGEAAWREGMRAVLIEREAEYQDCIRRRMALALAGPDERVWESLKAAGRVQGHDDLPLFGVRT